MINSAKLLNVDNKERNLTAWSHWRQPWLTAGMIQEVEYKPRWESQSTTSHHAPTETHRITYSILITQSHTHTQDACTVISSHPLLI